MYLFRLTTPLLILFLLFTNASPASDYYQNRLRGLLPEKALNRDNLGVYVESLTTGETIFKYNHNKSFIPASNNKLITSFAALNLLGKNYRYKTSFYSGGEITGGVLYGGVYVKGSGDPSFNTERLEAVVRDFTNEGIREIKGNIHLDDSYFDNMLYGSGWKDSWRGDYYCPPIGTFSLNYNTIDILVTPGELGQSAKIEVIPSQFKVKIVNNTETSGKSSALSAKLDNNDEYLTVNGRINHRSGGQRFTISVNNPTRYFGVVLSNLIRESGIKFDGDILRARTPSWATKFYTSDSPPLHEILVDFNKDSVNIIGESLVKTIGANFTEAPGSWEKGSKVIEAYLKSMGMDGELTIADGSGLSKENSVSPYMLVKILSKAYGDSSFSEEFISSLPVAGVDGTLRKRFRHGKIRGRVMAKTGYLNGVRALSGFVKTETGEVLGFSVISNGLGWQAKSFQNDLLEVLVDCCKK